MLTCYCQAGMGLFVKSFLLRRVVLIVTVTETAEVKYHDENSHWQKKKKDFPGSPVVKTPCFQCRGAGFDP